MDTRRPARWRDQHLGARLALLAVLAGMTVLTGWNAARGGASSFYAASARSMSESWPALLSGSFDPSATVTLDKLSGFAVPQAASVAAFGMSTEALVLPEVVAGLVTVWACATVGLRWAGVGTGLVAALAAATTPVFVSMFGHPMEDGMVTAALAVALVCWQRAAITGRWWPLVAAGLMVGVGFQAKMLQAWFVLPALVVGTLLASAAPDGGVLGRARRLARAAVLGAVAVAASLAWVVGITLTPAGSRPWVDGSVDDGAFAMVFGYNGVDRFLPGLVPGAVVAGTEPGHGHERFGGPGGVTKLLDAHLASQVAWLLPAALSAIVVGSVVVLLRRRTWPFGAALDTRAGTAVLVVLVVWLATAAGVLSVAKIPHTAYVAAIGVQLAVLAAFGWRGAVGLLRAHSPWLRALPVLLAAGQAVWWGVLARGTSMPSGLARPALDVATGALLATLVALVWRPRADLRRGAEPHRASRPAVARATIALTAGLALVVGPAAYSLQALDATRDGSGTEASVGGWQRGTDGTFRVSPADWQGGTPTPFDPQDRALVATTRRLDRYRSDLPLFLTDTWRISAPVIDATGLPVLTDGGFSGTVPVFTPTQIRQRIAHGLRVLVVEAGAPRTDPVLRAALAGGCRAVSDTFPDAVPPAQPWMVTRIGWTVWRCGLPGPSLDRLHGLVPHPLRTRRADAHAR
ncbi:4-amino-4-deoxy-L-arabinose transferase [Curtobacterium sp. 'Ferrero']|uniref:ArnT family glycosyltransferase n=1 Tax=Curtobacterium sp. 'Ferrero' TaxID=2033654 RepID=UPI000BC98F4F|nr:glycosyltransferase family 39 protein [Curtobacterium sp. 'Ferrero']PCN48875.1 4-amino-4-deoxy-L-arabinose transferase [Curtobacterium sp. 'Ferrero']